MSVLDLIYITRRRALEMGFTHEGTLFGVPAWLIGGDEDELVGCPKVPALQLWCLLADSVLEALTYLMREDQVLEAPVRVRGPIERTP